MKKKESQFYQTGIFDKEMTKRKKGADRNRTDYRWICNPMLYR